MSAVKNMKWSPLDYDECAVLAREAGEEMLARLDWMTLQPKVIVDAGCGTGELSARLQARYPSATVFAIDSSPEMIAHAKDTHGTPTYHCQAAETLPLADHSVDLLFANFLVPWHADVTLLLKEWRRVLREEGLLMLTALGPDTLKEGQGVWRDAVLPRLADMHDVGDGLVQAGFIDPVLDVNHYTLIYKNPEKLVHELGASGMLASPAENALKTPPPTEEGRWPVTYEVIYAHAFVPALKEEISPSEDGMVRIPLAHLRQRMRSGDKE